MAWGGRPSADALPPLLAGAVTATVAGRPASVVPLSAWLQLVVHVASNNEAAMPTPIKLRALSRLARANSTRVGASSAAAEGGGSEAGFGPASAPRTG